MRQLFPTIALLVFCSPSTAQLPDKTDRIDAQARTLAEVIQGLDAALQLLQRERVGLLRAYELSVRQAREAGLSLAPQRGQAPEWLGPALQQPAPSGMLELGALDWGTLERLRTLSGGALPENAKRVPGLVADVEDALTRTEAKWNGVVQWQQKLRELAQGKRQLQLRKPEQKDYDKWNGVLEVEAQAGTALDAWLLGRLGHRVEVRATGNAGIVSARLNAEVRYRHGLIVVERRGDEVVGLSPLVFLVGVEDSMPIEELYGGRREEPAARSPDAAQPAGASPPTRMLKAEEVQYEGFTPDGKEWVEEKREGQRTRLHPKRMVHDKTGIALVYIPAGLVDDHQFGDRHRKVAPFYLGETEVTVGQWKYFADSVKYRTDAEDSGVALSLRGPDRHRKGDPKWERVSGASWRNPLPEWVGYHITDDHPVTQVSWNDIQAFCRQYGTRLPTDTEWLHACGWNKKTEWPWGEYGPEARHYCNLLGSEAAALAKTESWGDGNIFMAPVRTYRANEFGIYDMCGNVWEWCGLQWRGAGTDAVIYTVRGGSWVDDLYWCRTKACLFLSPDGGGQEPMSGRPCPLLGFRVAISLQ